MADYDITVTRQARVLGSDATLSDAKTAPPLAFEPAFKKDVVSYSVTVPSSVTTITAVNAPTTDVDTDGPGDNEPDGAATVKMSLRDADEAPFTLLKPGRNDIAIEVTAEDGTTKKLYTLTVTRLMTTGPDDASLATLTLTDTTMIRTGC